MRNVASNNWNYVSWEYKENFVVSSARELQSKPDTERKHLESR